METILDISCNNNISTMNQYKRNMLNYPSKQYDTYTKADIAGNYDVVLPDYVRVATGRNA